MPDRHYSEVLVVGAGVIGASIAHSLAKDGCSVNLVDGQRVGTGCTGWSGGVVRCFHPSAVLSDRAVFGFQYFRQFADNTGIPAQFHRTGHLYFPRESDSMMARHAVDRLASVIPIKWLSSSEVSRQFGAQMGRCESGAVFESEAGYMDAAAVARAWVSAATRAGARLFEGTQVRGKLQQEGGRFHAPTNLGTLTARCVVVAAGYGTPQLLDSWGITHGLYVQAIQMDGREITPPMVGHPAFIDDEHHTNGKPGDNSGVFYVGHPTGVRQGFQLLSHQGDAQHSLKILSAASPRFTWLQGSSLVGGLRSPDCYSVDKAGYVGPVGRSGRLFVAAGFSGGGFKMAPWVGDFIKETVRSALRDSRIICRKAGINTRPTED